MYGTAGVFVVIWQLMFIAAVIMVFAIRGDIKDNTAAVREQTEILSHYNLIQASERIEEIVYFEQGDKPIMMGETL